MKIKHNLSKTVEYRAWLGMKQRCFNKSNCRYESYGGRGITVCERWLSFENFIQDMGCKPFAGHSIDRVNNDGNYEPSNCRWADRATQQKNRRKPRNLNRVTGDNHWTKLNPDKAKIIAIANIKKAHGAGESNPNVKLTKELSLSIKSFFNQNPKITMVNLGKAFGLGKETARKAVKGIAWCS